MVGIMPQEFLDREKTYRDYLDENGKLTPDAPSEAVENFNANKDWFRKQPQ